MFRVWIVFSVLFVLGVSAASYTTIADDFKVRSQHDRTDAIVNKYGAVALLPVNCAGARGIPTTDYSSIEGSCWYTPTIFRRLYPEYHDLSDHDLSEKLCKVSETVSPSNVRWPVSNS
jgi:hypothetical protein